MARTAVSTSAKAVTRTTTSSGIASRARSRSSIPSSPGMCRSVTRTSGDCLLQCAPAPVLRPRPARPRSPPARSNVASPRAGARLVVRDEHAAFRPRSVLSFRLRHQLKPPCRICTMAQSVHDGLPAANLPSFAAPWLRINRVVSGSRSHPTGSRSAGAANAPHALDAFDVACPSLSGCPRRAIAGDPSPVDPRRGAHLALARRRRRRRGDRRRRVAILQVAGPTARTLPDQRRRSRAHHGEGHRERHRVGHRHGAGRQPGVRPHRPPVRRLQLAGEGRAAHRDDRAVALSSAAVEQARANHAAAQAAYDKAIANRTLAERTYARQQALFETESRRARRPRRRRGAGAARRRADVEACDAAMQQARAALGQARAQPVATRASSRRSTGSSSRATIDVGQTVAASFQAPTLFTIAQDLTKMQVDTNVAEGDVGKLHDRMEATFTVDAYPAPRLSRRRSARSATTRRPCRTS